LWEQFSGAGYLVCLCLGDKKMIAVVVVQQGANAPCIYPLAAP
jgi:hypothetical protein